MCKLQTIWSKVHLYVEYISDTSDDISHATSFTSYLHESSVGYKHSKSIWTCALNSSKSKIYLIRSLIQEHSLYDLSYCGPVTSYGDTVICQHWFRCFVTSRHQSITRAAFNLIANVFCRIPSHICKLNRFWKNKCITGSEAATRVVGTRSCCARKIPIALNGALKVQPFNY